MAKANSACLVFILLIVILSNQVFHTQGRRNLVVGKSFNNAEARRYGNVAASPNHEDLGRHRFRVEDEGYVDSYRPTTPGHSPGIGHSKHD